MITTASSHVPEGDSQSLHIQMTVESEPKITRYLSSGPGQLILGSCPICKKQWTEWTELKEHVKRCRSQHQVADSGKSEATHPPDPVCPSTSAATAPLSAAAVGRAVVKDEPVDEYEMTTTTTGGETRVKEEPMDEEPSTSYAHQYQADRVKDEHVDAEHAEEECEHECEECNIQFADSATFVEHMKEHGYELAQDLDEDQIARLEAGLGIGPPSAKRQKETPSQLPTTSRFASAPSPRFPPLVAHTNPVEQWFPCNECDETCTTASSYREHQMKCHTSRIQNLPFSHACNFCKKRKFENREQKVKHEKDCRSFRRWKDRDHTFHHRAHACPYCTKRQSTAFVLGAHLMADHFDTIKKLRKNYLMASEYLPFRCNSCRIGFEDPRVLLNHFRLREEFGIPCWGNLMQPHSYKESLDMIQTKEEMDEFKYRVPQLPEFNEHSYDVYEDIYSNEWCPSDPAPSGEIDLTGKVQCIHCTEMWPRTQLKLHVKMEHPKQYAEMAPFKCKLCTQYSFYCPHRYAEHFESCGTAGPGIHNDRELVCAPRFPTENRPNRHIVKLPAFPEDAGNEMRPCRFCKKPFSPKELLWHQKNDHALEHFTDAPYQCFKCADVGFYRHDEFMQHTRTCNGEIPIHLESDYFAITAREVERKTNAQRTEIISFRALVDVDRRKFGTLAAFNRPIQCLVCSKWCSSLPGFAEHKATAHPHSFKNAYPFLCGGCGLVFRKCDDLRNHLETENNNGNTQCFDMAMLNGFGALNSFPRMPIQQPPQTYGQFTQQHQPRFGAIPHSIKPPGQWRSVPRINDSQNMFKNLARKEAAEKKNLPQLLPIRPLNLMSKSPLSGERFAASRKTYLPAVQSSPATDSNGLSSFYRELTVKQRQKSLVRVDFTAPLAPPRKYNIANAPSTSRAGGSGQPRPFSALLSPSQSRPPVHLASRPFIGLHAPPRLTSAPRAPGTRPPLPPGAQIVRVNMSAGRRGQPLPPRLASIAPGTKVPKPEPKQEPQY